VQVSVDGDVRLVDALGRGGLVRHDEVGHRLVLHGRVEGVDGRPLLLPRVAGVVAEVPWVVEAGDPQALERVGRVDVVARLQQHDVRNSCQPRQQGPVLR